MDRTNERRLSAVSGEGMDRVLPRRRRWLRGARVGVAAAAAAALVLGYLLLRPEPRRTLAVESDRVVVSPVVRGQFDDFTQIRARATPARTTFIDTAQGGQVEAIHVEDGATVAKGQLLIELSNTALQLDAISREAQITEQLNNLRGLELAHEQNRLAHRREVVEVNYQIARLTRQLRRSEGLASSGVVPRGEQEDMKEELAYYKRRRDVQLESFKSADRLQRAQLQQLRAASAQLEKNLEVARGNLDSLQVKAPAPGQLTAFTLEVGQSLPAGERIAQIDDPTRYKLTADIDEYYLNRVDLGQRADCEIDGRPYRLKIAKIRSQVQNGSFQADLQFEGVAPEGIRRGQTAQLRLQLGQPSEATLVPNAAFYNDTGGTWVFVVSSDRRQAVRRKVRLGRRNPQYIEVLEGLSPGDQIVTSAYTNYMETDRLELSR